MSIPKENHGDQPLHMLGYWAEKNGLARALEEYYPNLLASDSLLQHAVLEFYRAEAALEAIARNAVGELEDWP